MSFRKAGFLACLITALPAYSRADQQPELSTRARVVLHTLDKSGDGNISCEELASFLRPAIVTALREMGIEPRSGSPVPACGDRPTQHRQETVEARIARTEAEGKRRSPSKDYDEYFRELIQGTLNAAQSAPETEDSIGPAEIENELLGKTLPVPLSGTLSDVLPKLEQAASAPKDQAWTDVLESWLNIRQTFLDEQGISKPAKISLATHAADDETVEPGKNRRVYVFRTAVVLTPPVVFVRTSNLEIAPVLAFEANVTSDAPVKDQIVHRAGLSSLLVRNDSAAPFSSHVIDLTFD